MCIFHTDIFIDVSLINVVTLQGLNLCLVVLPLIVEDCLKLQHYCLGIIGNFHVSLIFINCNN